MSVFFTKAIVRAPAPTFSQGISTSQLGSPDYILALHQHQEYTKALKSCGVDVVQLKPASDFPDSTFVEDVAIVHEYGVILTNPGVESRKGEVSLIQTKLCSLYKNIYRITMPGTMDGGDILRVDNHFFIGISARTNAAGGYQLAGFLKKEGFSSDLIDITSIPGLLHLKSGISYMGDRNLLVTKSLIGHRLFANFKCHLIEPDEEYAANCVRINDKVLLPTHNPKTNRLIQSRGYQILELDMSEFRKMDGGLSCLSIRF
jgi:dimethylargininase